MKVLLVAPSLNPEGTGEIYSAVQWTRALSEACDLTVLTSRRPTTPDMAAALPQARVIAWDKPTFPPYRYQRFHAMVKPDLPPFFRWVRRWIAAARARGELFDIAHQILPQAMRYASPLQGAGLPYVVGPLGGSLETPPGFAHEVTTSRAFRAMRGLDRVRLRHDPWLRAGYADADLVLGVAPYIRDILEGEAGIPLKRFEPVLERGAASDLPPITRQAQPGTARLLHVGRAIRTKGLRDTVRAMAHLRDLPGVTLTSAGDGEDLPACRAEAARLGVDDRVTFLGNVPRAEVDRLYADSDIFVFPSFREPMGGVFFEAMTFALPIVTAARGGPDFIVDAQCGIRLPVTEPEPYARAIADAVRGLATDPARRLAMGTAAQDRLRGFGTWDEKAQGMVGLYEDVLAKRS